MKTATIFVGAVGVALIASSGRASAQRSLPDGPNRALVMRTCTACHDLGMVLGTGGRTRDGWNGTIDDMVAYGMSITAAERQLVLEYLATYLPAPR